MSERKKLIEELIANFHAIRNKLHAKTMHTGSKGYLPHSQLYVLSIIEKTPEIGIKELAKEVHVTSSAATQLVDSLVVGGYVVRKPDKKDRRALHLGLSKKGLQQVVFLRKQRFAKVKKLFDVLSEEELRTYLSLHRKILSRYE
jgi:DNA-binding MarR family transcriptional regulator